MLLVKGQCIATESLVIELDARTKVLDAKLKKTNESLERLEYQTNKNDKSFKSFGGVAVKTAKSLAKVAAVTLAVAAAVTAMTLKAAVNRRELELLSKQAKTTTEDFQALAFATKIYGINAEQIADISKDIADRIGEFSAAGTGTFQDYADVMKMTKEEAREVAIAFQGMSSQQVIGEMVSKMESAGVTGDKMTFVLESMGNDLSRLIPLFSENSKELLTLKARFDGVNKSLQITDQQAKELEKVGQSYELLTSQIGNAATSISSTLAPAMDRFFNDVIDILPNATQALINFVNTFNSVEDINSIKDLNAQMEASKEILDRTSPVAERVARIRAEGGAAFNLLTTTQERLAEKEFEAELKRFHQLKAKKLLLEETIELQKIADAEKLEGGTISGGDGKVVPDSGLGTGDEKQAIEDRFRDEEDLLLEKLERELKIIGDNDLIKQELHDEYLMNIIAMDEKAEEEKNEIDLKSISDKAKLKQKAAKAEIALENSVAKNAISLTKMVLGDSKAAAIAGLVMQKASALSANATATLSGSMLAYASQIIPGDPTSVVRAEAARDYTLGMGQVNAGLIIATGLGEAASIMKGGGGGGDFGGSSGGNDTPSLTPDFQPEDNTTGLELTEQSNQGISVQRIIISTDDGNDIFDGIAQGLEDRARQGA